MEPTEERLEALAKRRVEARVGWISHVTMYLVANTAFVVLWAMTGAHYPWFIWPLIGWGMGIVGHTITFWLGPDSAHGQRAVDREVQRLHAHR
jgi:hypothetical protein